MNNQKLYRIKKKKIKKRRKKDSLLFYVLRVKQIQLNKKLVNTNKMNKILKHKPRINNNKFNKIQMEHNLILEEHLYKILQILITILKCNSKPTTM